MNLDSNPNQRSNYSIRFLTSKYLTETRDKRINVSDNSSSDTYNNILETVNVNSKCEYIPFE